MAAFIGRAPWLALLFAALLIGACGGGGSSDTTNISAAEVLSHASEKFGAVKSFHFKLDHENGSTQIVFGLGLDIAEGDFLLPDRMSGEVHGKLGPTSVSVKLIAIGRETWITNPFTREFQRAPASVLDIIDPSALVASVSKSVIEPRLEGMESVDGVEAYRIGGTIRSEDLRPGLNFGDSGRTLEVEVWVGKDDYLTRRAKLKGALLPDENASITRELTLSKFDAPVTIEEPK